MRTRIPGSIVLSLALLVPELARAAPATSTSQAEPASPTGPAEAPSAYDEVFLKNGGFVRGQISEYVPNEYVVIVPRGQSEGRRHEWSTIAELRFAAGQAVSPETGPVTSEPIPSPSPVAPAPVPVPVADADEAAAVAPVEGPTRERPEIAILNRGDRPLILYHIDGETRIVGNNISGVGIDYSEICESPCAGQLTDKRGEFFVSGTGYAASKRFRLEGPYDHYTLDVTPRTKTRLRLGYALIILAPMVTTAMVMVPLLVDMPKSMAAGYYTGAALLGAASIAGGVTLMAFGRTKVEVLPGRSREVDLPGR